MALKDKPIQDYDLLSALFSGQETNTAFCYGPFQPIPLDNSEGSGDSNPEDNTFFDPQTQKSQIPESGTSMSRSSGAKRRGQNNAAPPERKKGKKKDDSYSPNSARMAKRYSVFCQVKARQRRMEFETLGANTGGATGSGLRSGTTINSNTNMDRCVSVMLDVFKFEQGSDMYFDAVDMFGVSPDLQVAFLRFTEPASQLKWLMRRIGHEIPTPPAGYDLNEPVRDDVEF